MTTQIAILPYTREEAKSLVQQWWQQSQSAQVALNDVLKLPHDLYERYIVGAFKFKDET